MRKANIGDRVIQDTGYGRFSFCAIKRPGVDANYPRHKGGKRGLTDIYY